MPGLVSGALLVCAGSLGQDKTGQDASSSSIGRACLLRRGVVEVVEAVLGQPVADVRAAHTEVLHNSTPADLKLQSKPQAPSLD